MVHLFYIESYFHLLVVDQIIRVKEISLDDCFFVTERGVQLPECYRDHLLYDGNSEGLFSRIKHYYSRKLNLKDYYGKEICAYQPFQFYFPSKCYFAKYVFFEEGFSAYSSRQIPKEGRRNKRSITKEWIVRLMLPFARKNVKGIVGGISCESNNPFETTLYRLSDNAYKGLEGEKSIKLETVKAVNKPFEPSVIKDSMVVVMDRLTAQGRPFDDKVYLDVLMKAIEDCHDQKRKMYVKLHPADSRNKDASERIMVRLSTYSPELITENLENLAVCNQNNVFLGSNSTVLYYAPILGDSNKSVSFARMLAQKDEKYRTFLANWGGTESFCELFGKEVECL